MTDLTVLEQGSFIQQILLLDELENTGDATVVEDLSLLCDNPRIDESLKQAISDTLRSLLRKNPDRIILTLSAHPSPARKIAIQLAGQLCLAQARPLLISIAQNESEGADLLDALSSLAKVADASAVEVFRKGALNKDQLAASICIQELGALGDADSIAFLNEILVDAGSDANYEFCSLAADSAITALSAIDDPRALQALVEKIHHRNPTVRRLIHRALIAKGKDVVDSIGRFLDSGDTDEKIMAAGLLGQIGHARGADLLLAAFDQGKLDDPNVRFASYDAFGQIPSLKTMICLLDALNDVDEMTLLAVVSSLGKMVNPGITAKVGALLATGGDRADAVARAAISAGAVDLFKALYPNEEAARPLMVALKAAKDQETLETFAQALKALGGERAQADLAALACPIAETRKKRILCVDDSRSILLFYRAVLSEMGFDVVTAEHGKAALDLLSYDTAFDAIITDMNMPEMNGIELTRKARENIMLGNIPIIMATTESDKSQIDMADRAGVNGYLVKPIKPDALAKALESVKG